MDLLDTRLHALIGDEGFERLVAAFYRRVPHDDTLSLLYPPHDLTAAHVRLRDFLIMRFGGPDRYFKTRGHPRLRMRHARFHIDRNARDRWVLLMEQALVEINVGEEATDILRRFFDDAATFLINRPG